MKTPILPRPAPLLLPGPFPAALDMLRSLPSPVNQTKQKCSSSYPCSRLSSTQPHCGRSRMHYWHPLLTSSRSSVHLSVACAHGSRCDLHAATSNTLFSLLPLDDPAAQGPPPAHFLVPCPCCSSCADKEGVTSHTFLLHRYICTSRTQACRFLCLLFLTVRVALGFPFSFHVVSRGVYKSGDTFLALWFLNFCIQMGMYSDITEF